MKILICPFTITENEVPRVQLTYFRPVRFRVKPSFSNSEAYNLVTNLCCLFLRIKHNYIGSGDCQCQISPWFQLKCSHYKSQCVQSVTRQKPCRFPYKLLYLMLIGRTEQRLTTSKLSTSLRSCTDLKESCKAPFNSSEEAGSGGCS